MEAQAFNFYAPSAETSLSIPYSFPSNSSGISTIDTEIKSLLQEQSLLLQIYNIHSERQPSDQTPPRIFKKFQNSHFSLKICHKFPNPETELERNIKITLLFKHFLKHQLHINLKKVRQEISSSNNNPLTNPSFEKEGAAPVQGRGKRRRVIEEGEFNDKPETPNPEAIPPIQSSKLTYLLSGEEQSSQEPVYPWTIPPAHPPTSNSKCSLANLLNEESLIPEEGSSLVWTNFPSSGSMNHEVNDEYSDYESAPSLHEPVCLQVSIPQVIYAEEEEEEEELEKRGIPKQSHSSPTLSLSNAPINPPFTFETIEVSTRASSLKLVGNKLLILQSPRIIEWDTQVNKFVNNILSENQLQDFVANETYLCGAYTSRDDDGVEIYCRKTIDEKGQPKLLYRLNGQFNSFFYSQIGSMYLYGEKYLAIATSDGVLGIFDLNEKKLISNLQLTNGGFWPKSIYVNEEETLLIAGGGFKYVLVVSLNSLAFPPIHLTGHKKTVKTVFLKNNVGFSGDIDGIVKCWNIAGKKEIDSFVTDLGEITGLILLGEHHLYVTGNKSTNILEINLLHKAPKIISVPSNTSPILKMIYKNNHFIVGTNDSVIPIEWPPAKESS